MGAGRGKNPPASLPRLPARKCQSCRKIDLGAHLGIPREPLFRLDAASNQPCNFSRPAVFWN
jgi:hypothetical protein